MRIKGTSKPSCGICEYAFFDREKDALVCKLNDEITEKNNECKKFRYDIYKYEPAKSADFGKFSQEDFEI